MNARERFLACDERWRFRSRELARDVVLGGDGAPWRKQGLPADVHLEEYLGVDRREVLEINLGLVPGFEPETLEETESYVIFRRADGVVCKRFKGGPTRATCPSG